MHSIYSAILNHNMNKIRMHKNKNKFNRFISVHRETGDEAFPLWLVQTMMEEVRSVEKDSQ